MSDKKQSIFNKIANWFKLKCPNCKNAMNDIGIHEFWGGSECIIYECTKCKKQWI